MAKDKSEKKDKKRKEIKHAEDPTAGAPDVEMVDADGPKVLNFIYHSFSLTRILVAPEEG
jgi:hypothetical protein